MFYAPISVQDGLLTYTYLSSGRSVVRRINLFGRTNTKFDDGHYVYIFESTWDNVS